MRFQNFAKILTALTLVCVAISANAQQKFRFTPKQVDAMLQAEWKKKGLVPSAPVADAGYLRRVYLDVTGTLPPSQVVVEFLADKSPNKRAQLVDALLDTPKYAENWTNYWRRVLIDGRAEQARIVDRAAFSSWLFEQFNNNTPWNKFVYDLITATGQNSAGGDYRNAFVNPRKVNLMDNETGARVNGAVNWVLKYSNKPEDLSGNASRIFLGVQIQCAQCHDHKTEKWTQEDFKRFTACFVNTRPQPINRGANGNRDPRVVLNDLNRPFVPKNDKAKQRSSAGTYAQSEPKALDGTSFADSENRRKALADWMTAPNNPWFAEAIVNRMWSHFMGRGFIEPIDDFRPTNPAIMPELLKKLADDFVASGYDMKHLIRTICATQAYQLSAGQAKTDAENTLWAKYRLKPLGPEETLNVIIAATNLEPVMEKQFGSNKDQMKAQVLRQFSFLFDVDEEFEQKQFEGTIPQALLLLNGALTNKGTSPIPGTALAEVVAMNTSDEAKIETLYLRTLSRKPTVAETKRWLAFINAPRDLIGQSTVADAEEDNPRARARKKTPKKQSPASPDPFARISGTDTQTANLRTQAYEDMFWALLNSSEFMFNH